MKHVIKYFFFYQIYVMQNCNLVFFQISTPNLTYKNYGNRSFYFILDLVFFKSLNGNIPNTFYILRYLYKLCFL
jgi:hypothetical protein